MTKRIALAVALVAACLAGAAAQPGQRFDLLIRNGRVMDGTGNPWFPADVAVQSCRRSAASTFRTSEAKAAIRSGTCRARTDRQA